MFYQGVKWLDRYTVSNIKECVLGSSEPYRAKPKELLNHVIALKHVTFMSLRGGTTKQSRTLQGGYA
jgi:hypothetical protein